MDRKQIFETVQDIFRDVFDDDELVLKDETNADDIEDWDSLNHINLVSAVEKACSIRFALGELQALKDVGEMISLIEQKMPA